MAKLRIGIVGCGEVAQIIHLPGLRELEDRFAVTALCDVSRAVVDGVGDRWNIPARSLDHRELLARSDVDAVLVANPNVFHAEVALAAMRAGKHVLLEKPICLTLEEADELLAAEAATGVTVMVGFMRRYSPAVLEARRAIAELGGIRLARVHDVLGRNALLIPHVAAVTRPTDLPAAAAEAAAALEARRFEQAIGVGSGDLAVAYRLLLGLSSHDISAMRELLGLPRRVLFAAQRQAGRYITAAFDYGEFVCQFETGIDLIPRFDCCIEVYGASSVVRVDWDTPYVRHLPSRLSVVDGQAAAGAVAVQSKAFWQDCFVQEWIAFHEAVMRRTAPKTSLTDARQDLVLFGEMIAQMRLTD